MFSYIWSTEKEQEEVFDDIKLKISASAIVPMIWREHCMECSMPLCYSSCPLYVKRIDGRCARFVKGIVPIKINGNKTLGARIEFRRWAKLQAFVPKTLSAIAFCDCETVAKRHRRAERIVRRLCDGISSYRMAQVTASLLERIQKRKNYKISQKIDGFWAVVNNEEKTQRELMLEILQDDMPIYKNKIDLRPGWNETFIPVSQIVFPNSSAKKRQIRAYLNADAEAKLTFLYFDFITKRVVSKQEPSSTVKCVAWDLDNTLWKGVIGDDGADNVIVNEEAIHLIQQLDERGILQTITSKNNYDIAWNKIVELGLEKMFLYPAINWNQKSSNLKNIADALNIGIDTFALIDDSSFERGEVSSALPQVRVYDVNEITALLRKKEFDVPISDETKKRRLSYLQEAERKKFSVKWGGVDGDYISFLRACELEMIVFVPKTEAEQTRCHELLLRSNQYNVSGNRYDKDAFNTLVNSEDCECLAFKVRDRFGDYGIVGFASLEMKENSLILKDFVMSCRVAMKHVERAFFYSVINDSKFENYAEIKINVVKTNRNKPLREQLLALPVSIDFEDDLHLNLILRRASDFENEEIINVVIDGE